MASLALPSLHVLDRRDMWSPGIETKVGLELLFSFRTPVGTSAFELMLWSLNLIAFTTPFLLRLRPRRARALLPLLLACGAAWWWASSPGAPEEAAGRSVLWKVDIGLFVWLAALAGMVTATMLRWSASIAEAEQWRRRSGAPTARLSIDMTTIAHLSPATRRLVQAASRIRQRLDVAPRDEQVIESLYDWVTDLRHLSEVERAELDRLDIPTGEVVVAVETLWRDVAADGFTHLERIDSALEGFIATSTTGGRSAAFR
jgi:hypothetical protein